MHRFFKRKVIHLLFIVLIPTLFMVSCNEKKVIGTNSTDDYNKIPPYISDITKLDSAKHLFKNKKEPIYTAVNSLLSQAERWMDSSYYTIVNKKYLPVSKDKHDYYSIGVYWWKDTLKTDGLPYIKRDGFRNPELYEYDAPKMANMIKAVISTAFAYHYTNKFEYAEKANGFLYTWFINEETKMNPHLEYGQAIPGISDGRGIGIIETVHLIKLIDAIGILYRNNVLEKENYIKLQKWFAEYNNWLITSEKGIEERNWHNNHGTSYDAQVLAYSLFSGNMQSANIVLDSIYTKRIKAHFETDGRQPHELERTRSLHYSIYNLRHYCSIAMLADKYNVDIWNYRSEDGRSIEGAINYLVPFIFENKKWPYKSIDKFERSKNSFFEIINIANNRIRTSSYDEYLNKYNLGIGSIAFEIAVRPDNFL